jgi:hypothetical protein
LTRLLRGLLAASLAVGWWVGGVEAQVVGLPVAPRSTLDGWSIHGTVAFPGDAAGGGTTGGISAGASIGWFAIEGFVAAGWPAGQVDWSGAGLLLSATLIAREHSPFRLRLFGGAGLHWVESDGRDQHGLVGASLGFSVPTPLVLLQPWVAPRAAYIDASFGTFGGAHPAFAAGIDAALLSGLGVRVAYDRIFADYPDATTFAIGLYYSFRPGF